MDARAQQRLYVFNHVLTGGLTAEEAARVLELSIHQVRRLRTLRRILAEASVRPTRTRRPPRHRSRRERMPREGQLLQVDGSKHRWFGPDLPFATLVAGIDDAGGCPAGLSAPRRTRSAT